MSTTLRVESRPAALPLVCFPHAGAGAASFARWLPLFPAAIATVRIQLPGREDLAAQPAFRRADDAVAALLPRLLDAVDHPIALYGHSMGALLAFEVARGLCAHDRSPVHLFVSGRRAPHLPASRTPIHRLGETEFAEALAAMTGGEPAGHTAALRRYALPLIKVDLELNDEYVYPHGRPLPCPITAFYGTDDPVVDRTELQSWQEHTTAGFRLHLFDGDHFFHQRHRVEITTIITETLGRQCRT